MREEFFVGTITDTMGRDIKNNYTILGHMPIGDRQ